MQVVKQCSRWVTHSASSSPHFLMPSLAIGDLVDPTAGLVILQCSFRKLSTIINLLSDLSHDCTACLNTSSPHPLTQGRHSRQTPCSFPFSSLLDSCPHLGYIGTSSRSALSRSCYLIGPEQTQRSVLATATPTVICGSSCLQLDLSHLT